MTYSTLLFDFDHTLFDSDGSEAAAFAETMERFGVADVADAFRCYEPLNSRLWAEVEAGTAKPGWVRTERFVRFVRAYKLDADPSAMADEFTRAMGANGELYPDARPLLEALAGKVTLGLVTNGITEIQRARIDRLGIGELFDAVAISEEVGSAKPDAGIFDTLFERLGRPARDCSLMIGDSLSSDIRGGASYGLATCWYNPDGRTAGPEHEITHEVRELGEVLPLVPQAR